MATIIFDLDYTLLDTSKLNKISHELLLKNNIPEDVIDLANKKHREIHKNPAFLEHVAEIEKLGHKVLKEDIDQFLSTDLKNYLKGPVDHVLALLIEEGHRLILLTRGHEYFQCFKIRNSGLHIYFDKNIYICEEKKEEIIEQMPLTEDVYFINDHADEIETVSKKYPNFHYVYIKGPKTPHDRFIDQAHIPTLDDISTLPDLIH